MFKILRLLVVINYPMFVLGGITLSFNTSHSNQTGFFTTLGVTIKLSCVLPDGASDVVIFKGEAENATVVVENRNAMSPRYKSLNISSSSYDVVIHNVSHFDSSRYTCQCQVSDWFPWFSTEEEAVTYLYVAGTSNEDESGLHYAWGTPAPPRIASIGVVTSLGSIAFVILLVVILLVYLRGSESRHEKSESRESIAENEDASVPRPPAYSRSIVVSDVDTSEDLYEIFQWHDMV